MNKVVVNPVPEVEHTFKQGDIVKYKSVPTVYMINGVNPDGTFDVTDLGNGKLYLDQHLPTNKLVLVHSVTITAS